MAKFHRFDKSNRKARKDKFKSELSQKHFEKRFFIQLKRESNEREFDINLSQLEL